MGSMITGAVIAAAFFVLGYYVRDKQPTKQHNEPKEDISKNFRNSKGLLSYKKYVSAK